MTEQSETYCAAPFVSLHYNVNGSIRPCCVFKMDTPLQHNDCDPLNHEYMENLRRRLLNNQKEKGCEICNLHDNVTSLRREYNQKYGYITEPKLKYLDLTVGNHCNLKCRMCSSWNSTKWIADELAMGKLPRKPVKLDFASLDLDYSHIEKIRFVGGEPALEQKALIDILHRIDEIKTLSSLELGIITNGTVAFNDELINLLSKCKSSLIEISIDGIGAVNEYQRTGSNWQESEAILNFYYTRFKNTTIVPSIQTSWSIINIDHVIEFAEYIKNTYDNLLFYSHMVVFPEQWSIRNLPKISKERILSKFLEWNTGFQYTKLKNKLKIQLEKDHSMSPNEVVRHIQTLDNLRGDFFGNVNPVLWQEMVNSCVS
jgi:hypothetical protein